MAVQPPGGPSNSPPFKPFAPGSSFKGAPRKADGSALSPEGQASEAEKEARARIQNAQKNIEDSQKESNFHLERLREDGEKQSVVEMSRQEEGLQNQKMQGYEAMRELRRQQQAELSQVKRDGEKDVSSLKEFYRNTTYNTERDGDQKLGEIRTQTARSIDYQRKTGEDESELTRQLHAQQSQILKETQEHQIKDLTDATNAQYDSLREHSAVAREQAESKFNENLKTSVDQYETTLENMQGRADHQLNHIRKDTAQKLAAYSSRQSDPFYKMLDTRARLSENSDSYVLTATIPEHEQDHVSVSIKGNQIVLSGARRNEEKLNVGPGRTQGTAAYQSYYESFPLTWPVESNQLVKEFRGDQLIVQVPKKNEFVYKPHQAKVPERVRVERPKFPDNLPGQKKVAERSPAETDEEYTPPPPGKNTRRGGPLL